MVDSDELKEIDNILDIVRKRQTVLQGLRNERDVLRGRMTEVEQAITLFENVARPTVSHLRENKNAPVGTKNRDFDCDFAGCSALVIPGKTRCADHYYKHNPIKKGDGAPTLEELSQ